MVLYYYGFCIFIVKGISSFSYHYDRWIEYKIRSMGHGTQLQRLNELNHCVYKYFNIYLRSKLSSAIVNRVKDRLRFYTRLI